MPCTSAVRASTSIAITPSRAETSSPGVCVASRGRNRFEVLFASRTGAPAGIAAYDAPNRPTASSCAGQPRRLTSRNLLLSYVVRMSGDRSVVGDERLHPAVGHQPHRGDRRVEGQAEPDVHPERRRDPREVEHGRELALEVAAERLAEGPLVTLGTDDRELEHVVRDRGGQEVDAVD